ncbi:MAG: pseudouridine synthase [Oscillospiraceae bacterium]
MKERLQKIISAAGVCSRRAAEELISSGKVTVNGETASLGMSADRETDAICVEGRPISVSTERMYIMLNKPRGFVTTLADDKGRRTVEELIRGAGVRLYPVGRLDMWSEGLLIMTDDGEAANRLMHPSHNVQKTYRAWVSGEDIAAALPILRGTMEIDGYELRPAEAEVVAQAPGEALLEIKISEGRNRQVRKMCEKAALRVTRLQRISEGELVLGDLQPGKWRRLTADEIAYIGELH